MKIRPRKLWFFRLLVSAVFVLLLCAAYEPVTVNASWVDHSGEIYQGGGNALGEFSIDVEETENEANWFEKILYGMLNGLSDGIFSMLKKCNASLDQLVFGRVMGKSGTAYFGFELTSGNPYGVIGSIVYNIMRGAVYVFIAAVFGAKLAAAMWKHGRGASTIAAKDAVKTAFLVMLLLAFLPTFLDLAIYIRDILLYAVGNTLYSNSDIAGGGSIIEIFHDLASLDGDSVSFLNTLMYLGLVVLNLLFMFVYAGTALNLTILFAMFPIVVLKFSYDKNMLNQWVSLLIGCLFVPVGDAMLLAIPCYIGKLGSASSFGTGDDVALGFAQIVTCAMMLTARHMVKQAIGVHGVAGEGSAVGMAMMAARFAGGMIGKGARKLKSNIQDSKSDMQNAKREEALSEQEKTEQASREAKSHMAALAGQMGDFTSGNTSRGPITGEIYSGHGTEKNSANEMAKSITAAKKEKNAQLEEQYKSQLEDNDAVGAMKTRAEIDANNAAIDEIRSSMKDNPAALREKVRSLQAEEESLMSESETIDSDMKKHMQDFNEAQKEVSDCQVQKETNMNDIKRIEEKMANLKALRGTEGMSSDDDIKTEMQMHECQEQIDSKTEQNAKLDSNINNAIARMDTANQAVNECREKLSGIADIGRQRAEAQQRYSDVMDTARDMQGVLFEQKARLVHENDAANKRLSRFTSSEIDKAAETAHAKKQMNEAKAEYIKASREGMPAETVEEKRKQYEGRKAEYNAVKSQAKPFAVHECEKIAANSEKLGKINSDLNQLGIMIEETAPSYGQESAQQIQQRISQNQMRANNIQKHINSVKHQMQLLNRGDVEGREKFSAEITRCENEKLDIQNENVVLKEKLNNANPSKHKGSAGAGTCIESLNYADKYTQERAAIASRYANISNFENPDIMPYLTHQQKADFYRKRAHVRNIKTVAGAVGGITGMAVGGGAGMFTGTVGMMTTASFGAAAGSAINENVSGMIAGRERRYQYEAGSLPSNFRTGNSFKGSVQNMSDSQRNERVMLICEDLRNLSSNDALVNPKAIGAFTSDSERELRIFAAKLKEKYPGRRKLQQADFEEGMVDIARNCLKKHVRQEALAAGGEMLTPEYLDSSEVYKSIEDSFMDEYFASGVFSDVTRYQ